MATNSEVKILGMEGTEQLVATVKNLLSTKADTERTTALETIHGNLDELQTNDKSSLVAAINEAVNREGVEIDPTLSIEGRAADAKSVGDAIKAMNHIIATDDGNGIVTLSISPLTPADEEAF